MKEIIIAVVTSGAFSALVSYILTAHSTRKRKDKGIEAGVRMMLYDRIKERSRHYIEQKYIPSDELEDIIEMHRIYHTDLGGNGFLDSLMEQVKALPITNK